MHCRLVDSPLFWVFSKLTILTSNISTQSDNLKKLLGCLPEGQKTHQAGAEDRLYAGVTGWSIYQCPSLGWLLLIWLTWRIFHSSFIIPQLLSKPLPVSRRTLPPSRSGNTTDQPEVLSFVV